MSKMRLNEGIVRYIFGPGTNPEIAVGEDGSVVYDFKTTYPSKVAMFVPIEVERSNYSNYFPKSFEDYFKDLDLEISRLSLLMERGNIFNRFPKTDFVPGQVLKTDGEYVVFRFDEMLEATEKTELLCRTPVSALSLSDLEKCYHVMDVDYMEYVDTLYGTRYLYWFLPVRRLFSRPSEITFDLTPICESLSR